MSFDKPTRNKLASMVGDCRRLLTDDIRHQLQAVYGLQPDGTALPVSSLSHLDERGREVASALRLWQEHLASTEAGTETQKRKAAFDRLAHETAFTVLNRLAALRMCEERGHVIECVRRGLESDGFALYERFSEGVLGGRGQTYRIFLERMFAELSVDLGALFDLDAPQSLVFPRERCLEEVLSLLNRADLAHVWANDETIGWIYQYFNSREERDAMRAASAAPRNSRELAVRNQFFTPRYVVEFLVDNTLGRIWYEMRKGQTALADDCRYLVRRKSPIFLQPGEPAPEPFANDDWEAAMHVREVWTCPAKDKDELQCIWRYALTVDGYEFAKARFGKECGDLANERLKEYQERKKWIESFEELRCCLFFEQRRWRHFGYDPEGEDLVAVKDLYRAVCERWDIETEFIPHRPKKDPRDLKILDPAVGSGHFLLYAFDLLETIYEEAWGDEQPTKSETTGKTLREEYAHPDSLKRALPELILRHNLHGIDIDLRACQIAALALWLRAQRSYQGLGLRPADRPTIKRSNIVCAEPMPGEMQLLDQFATDLQPKVLGQLVQVVFEKMALAGEAGSLLEIEEEIKETVGDAKKNWLAGPKPEQTLMFGDSQPQQTELSLDFSGITEETFWEKAEERIYQELQNYAERAENGLGYQRRLFAEDAAQGFAFIDLARKLYDVVLMNPPFGESSSSAKSSIERGYPLTKHDLYAAFIERGLRLLKPRCVLGAITSRTGFFLRLFQNFREQILLSNTQITVLADLGLGVMDDALVEAAAYCLENRAPAPSVGLVGSETAAITQEGVCRQGEQLSQSSGVVKKRASRALFFRVLAHEQKDAGLLGFIERIRAARGNRFVYVVEPSSFAEVPGSPFAYWVSERIRRIFVEQPQLNDHDRAVRQGMATANDFRFLRAWWEVPSTAIVDAKSMPGWQSDQAAFQAWCRHRTRIGKKWVFYPKGGEYSPYYADVHLVVNWEDDGKELKAWADPLYDNSGWSRIIKSTDAYFRPGLTWPERTTSGYAPQALPAGTAFSHVGQAILMNNLGHLRACLGTQNTRVFQYFAEILIGLGEETVSGSAARHYTTGLIARLPFLEGIIQAALSQLDELSSLIHQSHQADFVRLETACCFVSAVTRESSIRASFLHDQTRRLRAQRSALQASEKIEQIVRDGLGLQPAEISEIVQVVGPHPTIDLPSEADLSMLDERLRSIEITPMDRLIDEAVQRGFANRSVTKKSYFVSRLHELMAQYCQCSATLVIDRHLALGLVPLGELKLYTKDILSSLLGYAFDRWDIRFATGEKTTPELPDPFAPLPVCPPGMLQNEQRLPLTQNDVERPQGAGEWHYRMEIPWHGILVDDADHPNDIVCRMREVLTLIWNDRAEAIEQEACEILGARDLREYFRKPSFFFADHLKRYSKSRRQAPIYWPFSTASGSYTLWIYYHRLNDDSLYMSLNKYVKPKIDATEKELRRIESELPNATGREASSLRTAFEETEVFLNELQELRDEIARVADLPYRPNLNDGVLITASPLWKLFRLPKWRKELQECWKKLETGDYDWSQLAYSIWPDRVRDVCKRDRSIAIAHDLESLCELAAKPAKKKRSKKITVEETVPGDED